MPLQKEKKNMDLHNLPPNWSLVKLGDVCVINPKLKVNDLDEALEVSFIPMKAVDELSGKVDLTDERIYSDVKKGYTYFADDDVVFAKITPCMENGKIAILKNLRNKIGFGSTEFHVIRTQNDLLNKFLFYFLIQATFRKVAQRNMTGTAGHMRVPKTFVENFPIPLPPLPEQKKIVQKIEELISQLESGVASLKKAKDQIKLYRQSVLASAFSGRLINNEELIIKNQKEQNNYSLPPGWKWVKLGEIIESIQYGTSDKSNNNEKGIPVLRMGNIQDGKLDFSLLKYFDDDYKDISKYLLEDGDLLFNRTNSAELVGKSAIYKKYHPKSIFASYLIRVKVNKTIYISELLNYYLNSLFGRNFIKSVVSQNVGQANVNGTKLKNMDIPLIPFQQQIQIIEEIEKRFSEADNLEKAIDESLQKAEQLKQSILKQAFEGKLV